MVKTYFVTALEAESPIQDQGVSKVSGDFSPLGLQTVAFLLNLHMVERAREEERSHKRGEKEGAKAIWRTMGKI